MGTQYSEIFAALAAPFQPNEVRTRKGSGGQVLHYVTMRVVQNRLDSVIGPENWKPEFFETKEGIKCRLSLRIGGEWIAKEDGGGFAGMAAEDDNEKSAYSDSFKRAAVQWSISRYLYREGVPSYAGDSSATRPDPSAPDHNMHGAVSDAPPPRQYNDPPRSGKALFAWSRQVEDAHDVAMVKYLQNWGKLLEFPARMVDWDGDQVARAYEEGSRKLAAVQGPSSAPPEDPEALRRALKRMIATIARVETGRDEIAAPDCIRTVARLDALVPEPLRIPGEIDACADPARLRAYIDAATRRHDALTARDEALSN